MAKKTFVEKVAKMRDLQKEYFRTRNGLALTAAKKAEQEVDAELQAMNPNIIPSPECKEQYPTLFDTNS